MMDKISIWYSMLLCSSVNLSKWNQWVNYNGFLLGSNILLPLLLFLIYCCRYRLIFMIVVNYWNIKTCCKLFFILSFDLWSNIQNFLEEESTSGGNRFFIVIEIKAYPENRNQNNKPRTPRLNRHAKLGDNYQRSKTVHCEVYFHRFFYLYLFQSLNIQSGVKIRWI